MATIKIKQIGSPIRRPESQRKILIGAQVAGRFHFENTTFSANKAKASADYETERNP